MRFKTMVALAAASAALLAACSTNDNASDLPSDVNQADVTFAQQMIPHHEQATEMAGLAAGRTENPQVLDLASRINAAQGPEIKTMTGWLQDWGVSDSADSGSMDHSSMGDSESMQGMMSDDDMSALGAATGTQFDQLFLSMMVEHHEGAIAMAKTEQANGENDEATSLASKIEADQSAEIAEMNALLEG